MNTALSTESFPAASHASAAPVLPAMSSSELDAAYTALCDAMARVGETRAALFLAMVSLSLMARMPQAADVLQLIGQAERACDPA